MSLGLVLVVSGCAASDPTGLASSPECEEGILRSVPQDDEALAELETDPSVVRARLVEPALALLQERERLELNLFEDVCLHAVVDRTDVKSETSYVWNGRVEGVGESRVILVREDQALVGTVTLPGKFYQIRPLSEGRHAAVEVDPTALPPEAPPPTTTSGPR